MTYKECIDLGFKHIEDYDQVWKNEYGYEYFRVEKKLSKRHYIDWDVQKQTCEIITTDGKHNILNRWITNDIELVKSVIKMFTKTAISKP